MAEKAEKKKKPSPKDAKASKKGGGKAGFIFLMILFGAAVPFILPTVILCFVGMLPAVVAFATDSDRQKSTGIAVGAMNAAGITPFVIDLWTKGQTMQNVVHIIHDPSNWLIILGAAGIGQLIVAILPQIIASLSLLQAESRLKTLKQNLETMKERWGSDVGTVTPVEQLLKRNN
jgi:hypothetical protein